MWILLINLISDSTDTDSLFSVVYLLQIQTGTSTVVLVAVQ